MKQYLDLLRDVRENGTRKPTRAVLKSTGEKIDALSVFGRQMRFNLADGFPLVTTKRVNFNAIVHELIWFLSGSTNIEYLTDNGVHIWDAWADKHGDVGPIYPAQWRDWRGSHNESHDQIARVIDGIESTVANPSSFEARRLIVSSWNIGELKDMALPPCHVLFQFDVTDGRLSCHLYQRSADFFLGVPFNIASYALLTHMIARITNLKVGDLIISFGDAHIYCNHLDQVDEQLTRDPLPLPNLAISPSLADIDDIQFSDISLENYKSHPALRGEVAV